MPHAPLAVSPLGVAPKKNGKKRLTIDLRQLNLHVGNPHFKNGVHRIGSGDSTPQGLHGNGRPEGRLLPRLDPPGTSDLPGVSMGRHLLRIQRSSIRPLLRSSRLHQDRLPFSGLLQIHRHLDRLLPRQFPCRLSFFPTIDRGQGQGVIHSSPPGMVHIPGEVFSQPGTEKDILGFHNRRGERDSDLQSPGGETDEGSPRRHLPSQSSSERPSPIKESRLSSRFLLFSHESGHPSEDVPQGHLSLPRQQRIGQHADHSHPRGDREPQMVEGELTAMERESPPAPGNRSYPDNGRLTDGLGRSPERLDASKGCIPQEDEEVFIEQQRADGGSLFDEVILISPPRSISSASFGQCDGSLTHQQLRGKTKFVGLDFQGYPSPLRSTADLNQSEAHSGSRQRFGGQIVPLPGSRRLEDQFQSVSKLGKALGSSYSQSIRILGDRESEALQLQVQRPSHRGSGRIQSGLEQREQLRLSPFQIDSESTPSPHSVQSGCDTDSPSLDSSTMVFDSPDDQFGVLSDPEHEPLIQEGEVGIRGTEEREMDDRSIQSIWLSHITADWSPEPVAFLGQPFAESTLENYNQELEKYFDFCSQRGADPLAGSKTIIAELLEMHTRGLDRPHSTVKKVSVVPNMIYKPLGISSLDDVLIRHPKAPIVENGMTVPSRQLLGFRSSLPKLLLPTDKRATALGFRSSLPHQGRCSTGRCNEAWSLKMCSNVLYQLCYYGRIACESFRSSVCRVTHIRFSSARYKHLILRT